MKKIVTALILIVLDGTAMFLFHRFPSFFIPPYRNLSKAWTGFLAGLCSPVPFAVWDICALVLIVLVLVSFVRCIRKKSVFRWFSSLVLAVSVLVSSAVLGWMLNHYAPSLAEELGMEVRQYRVSELEEAAEYYLLKAGEYAQQTERDAEGHLTDPDFDALAEQAGKSYQNLPEPVFEGSTARVKRLSVIGEYLMYNGIIGMFMPLTGEAGVPESVPPAVMPYTMTHEAAHRLGIAGEEDANFAAFLACMASDDPYFVYSGCYNAFGYCLSALYRTNPERALEVYHRHDDDAGVLLVQADRADTAAVYRRYESPLQDVSDKINDTYLKTFDETDGIASYGKVTDELIAWYLENR